MPSLIQTPHCRSCFSANISACLCIPQAPANISKFLEETQIPYDHPDSLDIFHCAHCGLVQLLHVPNSEFYDDHISTGTHSFQLNHFQQTQAVSFTHRFELRTQRVIDIGCGDGNYIHHLIEAGVEAVGMEPSRRSRHIAQKRGFTVYGGYANSRTAIPGAPYDGFVCRQVLEHISDIRGFLAAVHCAVTLGAPGLFEVPSLEQTLQGQRWFDFCRDHINYFSCHTLSHVLQEHGFEIIEVRRDMNGEYIVALVRTCPLPSWEGVQSSLNALIDDINSFLLSAGCRGERVAFWGAGAKGLSILAAIDSGRIAYVVDSDPHKEGLYTPASHLPVLKPTAIRDNPVDAIIVSTLSFRDEVLNQLTNELRFMGDVYVIDAATAATVGKGASLRLI